LSRFEINLRPLARTLSIVTGLVLVAAGCKLHLDADRVGQPGGSTIAAISESELGNKSRRELELMRNAIYARHGRRFERQDLQDFFNQQPWYVPKYWPNEFPENVLTPTDRANISLIKSYEDKVSSSP
jgi:hypothetical protein